MAGFSSTNGKPTPRDVRIGFGISRPESGSMTKLGRSAGRADFDQERAFLGAEEGREQADVGACPNSVSDANGPAGSPSGRSDIRSIRASCARAAGSLGRGGAKEVDRPRPIGRPADSAGDEGADDRRRTLHRQALPRVRNRLVPRPGCGGRSAPRAARVASSRAASGVARLLGRFSSMAARLHVAALAAVAAPGRRRLLMTPVWQERAGVSSGAKKEPGVSSRLLKSCNSASSSSGP